MSAYYHLLSRESGAWCPQFGDHDLSLVQAELRDWMDHDTPRKDLLVVQTPSAAQSELLLALDALREIGHLRGHPGTPIPLAALQSLALYLSQNPPGEKDEILPHLFWRNGRWKVVLDTHSFWLNKASPEVPL